MKFKDNTQFKEYIENRLEQLRKMAAQERPADFDQQEKMLTSALKIMTHGTGPARRRFRRDYERRTGQ